MLSHVSCFRPYVSSHVSYVPMIISCSVFRQCALCLKSCILMSLCLLHVMCFVPYVQLFTCDLMTRVSNWYRRIRNVLLVPMCPCAVDRTLNAWTINTVSYVLMFIACLVFRRLRLWLTGLKAPTNQLTNSPTSEVTCLNYVLMYIACLFYFVRHVSSHVPYVLLIIVCLVFRVLCFKPCALCPYVYHLSYVSIPVF